MICSTPAFVLKSYDFRETSKIAVFFTRDFGKVKGVLKGIRTDAKKFASTLPLLSLNHIVFYKKRTSEIHLVGQCDLIDDFTLTRGDLKSFGFSNFAAELVDVVMPLEDAQGQVFGLIFDFLNSLKNNRQDMRHIFEIKILALSGFKPHFDSCVVCDAKISSKGFFSHSKGGLLCSRCHFHDASAEQIMQGTIASILYVERSNWANCQRLHMTLPVRRQLDKLLESFFQFHVGRQLKTASLIHELLGVD
jgi:DNA repair protein RecO (recombination protein O)